MSKDSGLSDLDLPYFGEPKNEPIISNHTYMTRLDDFCDKSEDEGFTTVLVYGDREHYANLTYLTGYDPRFEESLLVIDIQARKFTLILGHEGLGYYPISPVKEEIKPMLYQSLSLMGQDRTNTPPLEKILIETGVDQGDKVAVLGWKYFIGQEASSPEFRIEIPSYIADTLRDLVGRSNVQNANRLLMHPTEGMRAINEVDQLALFEYSSCHTSSALRRLIFGLKPGMTEYDAVRLLEIKGIPLSCHLMLSSGQRAFMGLPSPIDREIERGDPFTTAYGVWGSLNSRAGWVIENEEELPEEIRDYIPKLVSPYFEAVTDWYSHVGIGIEGGTLYDIIHNKIGDPFFGVNLNPGHLIHLEEWLNSPIYRDSSMRLRSGMALQVDVIPATGTPYFTTNMEDGIALADTKLRSEFASSYPDAWDRILARRDFMMEELGISLKPEVLPFSNIPAYLPPFLLSPGRAMMLR